jgi:signal transduction histidine kinase
LVNHIRVIQALGLTPEDLESQTKMNGMTIKGCWVDPIEGTSTSPGEPKFCLVLDEEWIVLHGNDALARWLGHEEPRELRGRPLAEFLTVASRSKLAALRRRLADGELVATDLFLRRVDGESVLARFQWFPPGILGPTQDRVVGLGQSAQPAKELLEQIEDLKREREAQLTRLRRLNARLERRNADLRAISHMIHHDVSNALNTIHLKGYLLPRQSADQVGRVAQEIQEYCQHIARVMSGFVALADLEQVLLHAEQIDLAAVLTEVLPRVLTHWSTVPYRLDTCWDAPTVWADPNHLRQVFENLLSNAFKYRDPSRSALELRLSSAPGPEDGHVILTFADNGLGIPADRQATVFDLFTRAHPTVSVGRGVGLAIVQRLVEANGGAITLESRPGVGTTFRVTLPAAPGEVSLEGLN